MDSSGIISQKARWRQVLFELIFFASNRGEKRSIRSHTQAYARIRELLKPCDTDSPKTIPVMEGVETRSAHPPRVTVGSSPKTIPVMEGVETLFCPFLNLFLALRRLSPLWRGLRPSFALTSEFPQTTPKTIPVMEGVETKYSTTFAANMRLRRLSPLWRGLRPGAFFAVETCSTASEDYPRYGGGWDVLCHNGTHLSDLFSEDYRRYGGGWDSCWFSAMTTSLSSEDYPRYGGGWDLHICVCIIFSLRLLRRLSPLWRGLRHVFESN